MCKILTKNNPGTVVTVGYDLSHIAETTLQSTIDEAMKRANWSWNDLMIGFNEIGYDVTANEKERIMKRLFTKKLKYLLIQENKPLFEGM